MPKIPTPLTWKRRNIAVFEPYSFTNRLYAVPVSGLVAGPFVVYKSPHGNGFTLAHLPSQSKIISLEMQNACKDAAELYAACDVNWWSCIPEEVIGPDSPASTTSVRRRQLDLCILLSEREVQRARRRGRWAVGNA